MTRRDAGFATAATIQINLKRVLLAGLRFRERNEVAIILRLRGNTAGGVELRKAIHRRERLLLGKQVINQRALIRIVGIGCARLHLLNNRKSNTPLSASSTKNPILKNSSGLRSMSVAFFR